MDALLFRGTRWKKFAFVARRKLGKELCQEYKLSSITESKPNSFNIHKLLSLKTMSKLSLTAWRSLTWVELKSGIKWINGMLKGGLLIAPERFAIAWLCDRSRDKFCVENNFLRFQWKEAQIQSSCWVISGLCCWCFISCIIMGCLLRRCLDVNQAVPLNSIETADPEWDERMKYSHKSRLILPPKRTNKKF